VNPRQRHFAARIVIARTAPQPMEALGRGAWGQEELKQTATGITWEEKGTSLGLIRAFDAASFHLSVGLS
jgi:hypothetical protein